MHHPYLQKQHWTNTFKNDCTCIYLDVSLMKKIKSDLLVMKSEFQGQKKSNEAMQICQEKSVRQHMRVSINRDVHNGIHQVNIHHGCISWVCLIAWILNTLNVYILINVYQETSYFSKYCRQSGQVNLDLLINSIFNK